MQFFKSILAVSALASFALANTVTYLNQDSLNRTIIFTPSAGASELPNICVGGYGTIMQTFPFGWNGNWYTVVTEEGDLSKPGMLGEITFDGWGGFVYYDVSTIVDPTDVNNVKQIFPKDANVPLAGCTEFPCADTLVYNVFNDDLATKSSAETDYICTLGTPETQRRRGAIAEGRLKRVVPLTGEPQL